MQGLAWAARHGHLPAPEPAGGVREAADPEVLDAEAELDRMMDEGEQDMAGMTEILRELHPDFDESMREIDRLDDAKLDVIGDTRSLRAFVNPAWQERRPATDRILLNATTPQGDMPMRISRAAHAQVASTLGIDKKYYDRMLEAQPGLACTNVNTWLAEEPKNRLLRMLQPITETERATAAEYGTVTTLRAMLSDVYRPVDHGPILKAVAPVVYVKFGGTLTEWQLNETHFHVRFNSEDRDVMEVAREIREREGIAPGKIDPGHRTDWNELVSFGVAIRNSETGHGAIAVEPAIKVLRCLNLWISDIGQSYIRHVGSKQDESTKYRPDTRRLDDAATVLKVRDRVEQVFSETTVQEIAGHMAEGMQEVLRLPEELPMMEFVEGVGRSFDLTEAQLGVLRDEYVDEVAVTGRHTRFGLGQAFTATAKKLAAAPEGIDFEQKRELERIGWRVLGDSTEKLIGLAKDNLN